VEYVVWRHILAILHAIILLLKRYINDIDNIMLGLILSFSSASCSIKAVETSDAVDRVLPFQSSCAGWVVCTACGGLQHII